MQEILSPPDEVRRLAQGYMRRTGMAPADFARRVGYAYATLGQFLSGKYRRGLESKEAAISEAILRFLGTSHNDVAEPFTGKLYEIGNTRAMRGILRQMREGKCILLAYAPPGSGKTDVARALIPEFSGDGVDIFRIYCRAAIGRRDLMRRIAVACGSIADLSIERTISNLRYDHSGRRVALYLDEAQHLSVECFETVRELYDELNWSLCFAGSHQLGKIFAKWTGDLEQLERRVVDKITLPAVTAEEADGIIRSELPSLSAAKIRALIEGSHVDIRIEGVVERYLSIGRIMANIREMQDLMPEAADRNASVVSAGGV
ncbi:MAG: ATP-binding protein [Terracidiphilus sp.]|jgi:DNA transposition AAA+ family ATPase